MGSASCAFSGEMGSLLPVFSLPALISHPDDTTRAVELGGAPHTAPSARVLLAVTASIPVPWLQLPLAARCHEVPLGQHVVTCPFTPGFGGWFGAVGRRLAVPTCSLAGAQGCFLLTPAPLSLRSVSLKPFGSTGCCLVGSGSHCHLAVMQRAGRLVAHFGQNS